MKTEPTVPTPQQMLSVLTAIPHLHTWIYDEKGSLLESSCPQAEIFHRLFCQCGYPQKISDYAKNASAPYALSIYMGLVWYAVLEKQQEKLARVYLLGPVFQYPVTRQRLDEILREYESMGMNFRSRRQLLAAMEDLPVIPHTQLASYAILLHYCVTGETLSYEDLNTLPDTPPTPEMRSALKQHDDHFPDDELEDFYSGTVRDFPEKKIQISPSVYRNIRRTEDDFLGHLRLGTLPLEDPQTRHMALLPTDASGIHTPTGKTQLSAAILTALYARTAADAGLSCEESYHLADEYLGKIYELHSPMGLQTLMGDMVEDYTRRVQSGTSAGTTSDTAYSREIQLTADYIRNHLSDAIPLSDLAELTGYTPYYLSRKFKQETGCPLPAYIRQEKLKYAAHLLITTESSVAEITEAISFSSRSHFSEDFAKQMGMPPGEYRRRYGK